MLDIMQALEPRKEPRRTVIYNELDEVNEVLFFSNGTYQIGFELNR